MIMITVCNCLIFKTSVFKYFPMDVMAACALVPAAGFIIGKFTGNRPGVHWNFAFRIWMLVCSLWETKSKENNHVGNWIEKCSNLFGNFNSLISNYRCWSAYDDATLFPFLSGMFQRDQRLSLDVNGVFTALRSLNCIEVILVWPCQIVNRFYLL